jgi:hypothetical protein
MTAVAITATAIATPVDRPLRMRPAPTAGGIVEALHDQALRRRVERRRQRIKKPDEPWRSPSGPAKIDGGEDPHQFNYRPE